MSSFLQQLVNGLTIGSFYALVALGYTMVYGVIRLINFAHGDLFMVGSFVGFTLLGALGSTTSSMSSWFVIPIVFIVPMAVVGLLGAVIERLAYRPLRRAPRLSPLITAIGVSLGLEVTAQLLTQSQFRVFPSILPSTTWQFGTVVINASQVLVLPVTVALMAALYLFVNR